MRLFAVVLEPFKSSVSTYCAERFRAVTNQHVSWRGGAARVPAWDGAGSVLDQAALTR